MNANPIDVLYKKILEINNEIHIIDEEVEQIEQELYLAEILQENTEKMFKKKDELKNKCEKLMDKHNKIYAVYKIKKREEYEQEENVIRSFIKMNNTQPGIYTYEDGELKWGYYYIKYGVTEDYEPCPTLFKIDCFGESSIYYGSNRNKHSISDGESIRLCVVQHIGNDIITEFIYKSHFNTKTVEKLNEMIKSISRI